MALILDLFTFIYSIWNLCSCWNDGGDLKTSLFSTTSYAQG